MSRDHHDRATTQRDVGLCTDPQDVDALVLLNPAGFVSVAASMAVLGD